LHDEEGLNELEEGLIVALLTFNISCILEFFDVSEQVFRGTVAAGDGIVIEISKPKADQVNGDVNSFFTRKGYFGSN
jgi:hypothetical protein